MPENLAPVRPVCWSCSKTDKVFWYNDENLKRIYYEDGDLKKPGCYHCEHCNLWLPTKEKSP